MANFVLLFQQAIQRSGKEVAIVSDDELKVIGD
jgi:hypothetical protein